jgi:hypothetical protein
MGRSERRQVMGQAGCKSPGDCPGGRSIFRKRDRPLSKKQIRESEANWNRIQAKKTGIVKREYLREDPSRPGKVDKINPYGNTQNRMSEIENVYKDQFVARRGKKVVKKTSSVKPKAKKGISVKKSLKVSKKKK